MNLLYLPANPLDHAHSVSDNKGKIHMMRPVFLLLFSIAVLKATDTSASQTWIELKAKREALNGFHQEFDASRTFKLRTGTNQSSKWPVVLDVSKLQWREISLSGSGTRTRLFDGNSLFLLEEGDDEYMRPKLSPKEPAPEPRIYDTGNLDWLKAVERSHAACPIAKLEHQCVTLEIPLKPSLPSPYSGSRMTSKVVAGVQSFVLDMETGLVLSYRLIELVDNQRGGYQEETTYALKRMSYGGEPDQSFFHLPAGATTEVKELSHWNAARMKKQLSGKPAADLTVKDLQGKPIHLSELKGKTVLLDFWATWCGPCRADGPALDKLYAKYGDKNLIIVGVSVDEDRPVVEKFLSQHPHSYPVVLSTENEIPRPYQIGVFPTYIVIDGDGNFASATEGDRGFAELRKLLRKAGLETE
jgi:thiol-disulfide isomerase/thioredoxin